MTQLIAKLIPLALGVAASPISVVAILVILLTRRARLASLVFAVTWSFGIAVALGLAVYFADRIPPIPQGLDLPFEGLVTALLGIGLIGSAVLARMGRFRAEDPYEPPRWLSVVDNLSPLGGAVIALTNAVTSPKNIGLAVAAGLAITGSRTTPAERTTAETVYVIIASTTVWIPVIVFFVGGERARDTLARWKTYITARAAAVMELTLLILGIVLAVRGLANLISAFS